jgi:hypothetical protein
MLAMGHNEPLVSVVVPTFARPRLVVRTNEPVIVVSPDDLFADQLDHERMRLMPQGFI